MRVHTHACMYTCTHTHTRSYAEAVDTYESEEELRFLLPLKEYIATVTPSGTTPIPILNDGQIQ